MNEEKKEIKSFRNRLENAKSYSEIWEIVKDTVYSSLHKRRNAMMLFLADLPVQLGAYHTIGTNNIVLNRVLVQIVEASITSKRVVSALVYNLLVHEYLHALGEYSEAEVRRMVYSIARECFGEDYVVTTIAEKTPWALLKGIPLEAVNAPRQIMEIVKDFEKSGEYIV